MENETYTSLPLFNNPFNKSHSNQLVEFDSN